jgi:hypothetical protein
MREKMPPEVAGVSIKVGGWGYHFNFIVTFKALCYAWEKPILIHGG